MEECDLSIPECMLEELTEYHEFRTANKHEAARKMTELLHRGEFRGYSREGNTHVILFARRRCTSQ